METEKKFVLALMIVLGLLVLPATVLLWATTANAQQAVPALASLMHQDIWVWGLLSAALATGLSALGAAIAVAKVGSAAVGALAEKPELFGRLLILVGLAEGIAIYGLIISILILNRLV